MTLGERLKDIEDEKTRERVARRSELLRQFVKTTLVSALETNINDGGNGIASVEAPRDISFLFAGAIADWDDNYPYINRNSGYYLVWRELDAWAESQNLMIVVGEHFDKNKYYHIPWADRRWGGRLQIALPKPEIVTQSVQPVKKKCNTNVQEYAISWMLIIAAVSMAIGVMLGMSIR